MKRLFSLLLFLGICLGASSLTAQTPTPTPTPAPIVQWQSVLSTINDIQNKIGNLPNLTNVPGVGTCPAGQAVNGLVSGGPPTCIPVSSVPGGGGVVGPLSLANGTGIFSKAGITPSSFCKCNDTSPNKSGFDCYTVSPPNQGSVVVIGDGNDSVQVSCSGSVVTSSSNIAAYLGMVGITGNSGNGVDYENSVCHDHICPITAFGAYVDYYINRTADGTFTNSTTFTSATASFNTLTDVGKTLYVVGAGPSSGIYSGMISSVTNGTTVVVTPAATSIVANQSWGYGHDDSAADQACETYAENHASVCLVPSSPLAIAGNNVNYAPGTLTGHLEIGNPSTAVVTGMTGAPSSGGIIGFGPLASVIYYKPLQTQSTTIAGGSVTLPSASIQVTATAGFVPGDIYMGDQIVNCLTITDSTHFGGCVNGIGTIANSTAVYQGSAVRRQNSNFFTLQGFNLVPAINDGTISSLVPIALNISCLNVASMNCPAGAAILQNLNVGGAFLYSINLDLVGNTLGPAISLGAPLRWVDSAGPAHLINVTQYGGRPAQIEGQAVDIVQPYFQAGIRVNDGQIYGDYARMSMTIHGGTTNWDATTGLTINDVAAGGRGMAAFYCDGCVLLAGPNGIFGGAIGMMEMNHADVQGDVLVSPNAICTAPTTPIACCSGLGTGSCTWNVVSPAIAQCSGNGTYNGLDSAGGTLAGQAPCCTGVGAGTCNGIIGPSVAPFNASPSPPFFHIMDSVLGWSSYVTPNFSPIGLNNPGGTNAVTYELEHGPANGTYYTDFANYPKIVNGSVTFANLATLLRQNGQEIACSDCKNQQDAVTAGAVCVSGGTHGGALAVKQGANTVCY